MAVVASSAPAGDYMAPPLGKIPPRAALCFTERFSETFLRRWRSIGDPLADDVVAELAAQGNLKNIHNMLELVESKAAANGGVYEAFLAEVYSVPEWVDFHKMERGQQIIARYMHHMYLSLANGSLVAVGGQFPSMVGVVNATGMLNESDPKANEQRLSRTSRFVINLCSAGEILPGREGHTSVLQVRLLHAAVRHYVVKSGKYTDTVEVAINQHDLAITLGLFGYVNLRNLRRMGISFSHADVDAFMHLWRYVGWVLGIHCDLLPKSFADQQEFFLASTLMMGDNCQSCGPQVARAFTEVPHALSRKTGGVLPAGTLEAAAFHLLNLLAGEEYVSGIHAAGGLSGRPAPLTIAALQAAGNLVAFAEQRLPLAGKLMESINLQLAAMRLPAAQSSPHQLRSRL